MLRKKKQKYWAQYSCRTKEGASQEDIENGDGVEDVWTIGGEDGPIQEYYDFDKFLKDFTGHDGKRGRKKYFKYLKKERRKFK